MHCIVKLSCQLYILFNHLSWYNHNRSHFTEAILAFYGIWQSLYLEIKYQTKSELSGANKHLLTS